MAGGGALLAVPARSTVCVLYQGPSRAARRRKGRTTSAQRYSCSYVPLQEAHELEASTAAGCDLPGAARHTVQHPHASPGSR
jgi:hypothetical protein